MTGTVKPGDLAPLEEERDFLLRSLDDLEREYEAGDIDEADYRSLRDDYTARAATILRTLQATRARPEATPVPRPARRSNALLWVVGTLLFATIAGIAVAFTAGRRNDGDFATGEGARGAAELMAQAEQRMGANDPEGAVELYTKALAESPGNVQALTYRGWIQFQTGELEKGRADIDEAVRVDPNYPDAHVFRAVILLRDKRYDEAAAEYAKIQIDTAPPIVKDLVEGFKVRERILAGRVAAKLLPSPPPLASSGFTADEVRVAAETMAEVDPAAVGDAIKLLTTVIDAAPRDGKARASFGWILGRSSQGVPPEQSAQLLDRARKELDLAIQIDASYPYARVYRSFVAFAQNKPADAESDLQAFDALSDKPRDLLALIEQQGLRRAIAQALGK